MHGIDMIALRKYDSRWDLIPTTSSAILQERAAFGVGSFPVTACTDSTDGTLRATRLYQTDFIIS